MKIIVLAFQILALLTAPLMAQTPATVQVTATSPAVGNGAPVALVQSVRYMPRNVLTAFTCAWAADGLIQPGDAPVVCTLTANQKVRNGLTVNIAYGQGLAGPPTATVPNAASATTFTITAVDAPVAVASVNASSWSVEAPTDAGRHFIAFVTPCCLSEAVCLQLGQVEPNDCPAQR
jgi:hypothetical protein